MRFEEILALFGLNQQTPANQAALWNIGDSMLNENTLAMAGIEGNKMQPKILGFLQGPHGKGDVTYTGCDDKEKDDIGTFLFDASATTNDPDPVTVPCDLNFHLEGAFSDSTHVDDLHVAVKINGVPLWSEHHKINKDYADSFAYDLKWTVPSIAPHGTYLIRLSATGSSGDKKGTALCVDATMQL